MDHLETAETPERTHLTDAQGNYERLLVVLAGNEDPYLGKYTTVGPYSLTQCIALDIIDYFEQGGQRTPAFEDFITRFLATLENMKKNNKKIHPTVERMKVKLTLSN